MRKDIAKAIAKDLGPIVFRNLFSIVSIIIGGLSIALIVLGNSRDGIFLGSVISINIIIGIIQEIRAKLSLEKLQLSTKQKYDISRDGKDLKIYAEKIIPGDIINIKLGDQIPTDSIVIESEGLECNLALLSGESDNVSNINGDKLISGSIVVAGSAKIKATKKEENSYLYKMNQSLKKYETSYSPIQRAILKFIKIMSVILVLLGAVIVIRSLVQEGSLLTGFVQVAALASTIIAEGLLLASTVLFAYGAIKMAKRKVLLQQINSIENLGRMSVVCIDKTGTITESLPTFDKTIVYDQKDNKYINQILSTYIKNETSDTATLDAIRKSFEKYESFKIDEIKPFSSSRKFSILKTNKKVIIIGAAEKFLSMLGRAEAEWAKGQIDELAKKAKRIIFIGEGNSDDTSNIKSINNLRIIGFVIFSNPLKSGSAETIKALQSRGVQVVVISGDNPTTVEAIAKLAGVKYNGVTTGDTLANLNTEEIIELINRGSLFARTLPEQKQKIVEAIRRGRKSVAMIGDGANDAMAIKASNIGIAMFNGAPATRQIADVVLTNNSFSAIPKGIKLSDTIITTLEMIGCLFFTRVWSGIFLLLITLFLQIEYPLQPRNITLLNIFIVTLPIILWLSYPRHRDRKLSDPSYLARTLPFSVLNAFIIALISLVSILTSNKLNISVNQIPMQVFIIFFIMSIYSIGLIPRAIGALQDKRQQRIIYVGYILAAAILVLIYLVPKLSKFFSLNNIDLDTLILSVALGYLGTGIQYLAVRLNLANKAWLMISKNKSV